MALGFRRSPLREKPLRVAGQSLDEEIHRVIARDGHEALLPAGWLAMVAVCSWGRRGCSWSRPRREASRCGGRATIRYNGETLAVAGERPRREPIQQALALARWVSTLINDSTSRNCFVRPVVLYPGWLLEITIKKPSVWVLNPGMLAARINRERTRLGAEDIALISLHISRYGHMALDDHARSQ